MTTVVACWHHEYIDRLGYHLERNRIDLYGRNEITEEGTKRLDHWWNKMRLKRGDKIRIVVGRQIVAFAVIDGEPEDLPAREAPRKWGSAVKLTDIDELPSLFRTASCAHLPMGSHRFDGPKTSLLDH